MTPLEILTERDKEKILNYIKTYVGTPTVGIDELLTPWSDSKGYLLEKFNHNLIFKERVEFKEGYGDIADRLDELFRSTSFYMKMNDAFDEFYRAPWNSKEYKAYQAMCEMFNYDTLIANRYERSEYVGVEIPLPNGKNLRIQKDCKPMKVLGKLAKEYQVEGFEEFRLRHSLCLNTKNLYGDLCLSIHPLDYMTMSINGEGWETCMNWEDGEYKQGTVEMMNSPCVVVGYLSNGDFNYGYGECRDSWNSKKWRCLFIVDDNFIMSVKQYPYENDNLVNVAVSKLAQIMGWGDKLIPFKYEYSKSHYGNNYFVQNNRNVRFVFEAGAMYNDFGTTNHYAIIDPSIKEDLILDGYCYSGLPECMRCGNTCYGDIGEKDEESYLLCRVCEPRQWCDECGECIEGGEEWYTTDDGDTLCQYCWDNYTFTEALGEGIYRTGRRHTCYLSKSEENLICGSYCESIEILDPYDYTSCVWNKYFNIENPRSYYSNYWVSPSECTAEGLKLFSIYDEEDLKKYIEDK